MTASSSTLCSSISCLSGQNTVFKVFLEEKGKVKTWWLRNCIWKFPFWSV